MSKKIMVIAGEASGDLHGARLVAAMKEKHPDYSFLGMGAQEMAAQGVEILFDAAKIAVVGIAEVLTHLKDIVAAQKILRHRMVKDRPDLLVIIDFPDFNLLLASKAKKLGIPVFYYITPQVWAWRKGRVKTIKKVVDRLGVILPFEEQFFKEHGLVADYVGHPLLDSVEVTMDRQQFCDRIGCDTEQMIIGILPGSRKKEISSLLPVFLEAADRLLEKSKKEILFLILQASTINLEELKQNGLDQYKDRLNVQVVDGNRYDLMAHCDAVIAASGTVALELALVDTPMVIVYKTSPLTACLAKLLTDIEFISLVNLIAGYQVVPELLQEDANPERIEQEISAMLFNQTNRLKILEGLKLVRQKLGDSGASAHAAALVDEILADDKSQK